MDDMPKKSATWIDSLSVRVKQALFAVMTYLVLLLICFLTISP